MRSRYPHVVAAGVALLLGTACGGQSVQSIGPDALRNGSTLFAARGRPADRLPGCSAAYHRPPGKFTILAALGDFSGGSFAASGLSLWGVFEATKGLNQLPIFAPKLGGRYTIYYGTYTLDSGLVGCFYLAKFDVKGVSFNGAAVGWPNLTSYGKGNPEQEGLLEISVRHISAKSGSGTFTRKSPSGKSLGGGTVRIKGSKIVDSF